jgi:putative Holliday junction resolvase
VSLLKTRLLGIDYGSVRIGLSICDRDRKIASPLETYQRRSPELDAKHFLDVIQEEQIGGLVLGLPIHNNGQEGQKAREVREFGKWLQEVTGLIPIYWDERFTTVEAENALWSAGLTHKQRKQRRDKVAAQLLLQGYLDSGCPESMSMKALDAPE